MKQQNLFITLFFALFCTSSIVSVVDSSKQNPLLIVLLMVKDEKEVIVPTLETYLSKNLLAGNPDTGEVAYVLFDNGSTDGTDTLAEEFFKKYKIKNYLIKRDPEWLGFGRTRNKGLAVARAAYPQATFILFPDAEWYIRNFDQLIDFCRQEAEKEASGVKLQPYYRIWMKRSGSEFGQQRLFLAHDDVEFEKRRVHECPTKGANAAVPKHIYWDLGCSKTGYEKSRKRWFRDRQEMLLDLLEDPRDPRTVFYLALTELWLENYRNAYTYFKMRITLSSFPEEDYFAHYYLAKATEALASSEPESFKWDESLKYYLQAYSMRPHRAEPLVRIAQHYLWENNHALSYVFARRACELPYPLGDVLPYDKHLYDFDRHEILSRCAWYIQEYEVGEEAAKKAIEAHPNLPQSYKNLAFYWERKK